MKRFTVIEKFAVLQVLSLLCLPVAGQSGGSFVITQSVIANGGQNSTGGAFVMNGTAGQPSAGTAASGSFILNGGFVQPVLPPVAANVWISGRVTTANGSGIRNVRVALTDQTGNVRTALTSAFGYYRFDEIEAGQTVVISIAAKRYVFANPTRVVSIQEALADVDFTSEP